MGDYDMLERLQNGESLLEEFTSKFDPVTRLIVENGGLSHSLKNCPVNRFRYRH